MEWPKPRYTLKPVSEQQFRAALTSARLDSLHKIRDMFTLEIIRVNYTHLVDAIDQEIERRKTVS